MEDRRDWHRLLGVILQDYCQGTALDVEVERDLSLKQQWLDVILIHKRPGQLIPPLPDGFEDLATHNLITFKSYQSRRAGIDAWTLKELVGHYVNYRKQASPSKDDLLAETDFRLFAVSARSPASLIRQGILTAVRDGVYDCDYRLGVIRVIVVKELEQKEHNALFHLFSASEEQVRYGAQHYRQRSPDTTSLLRDLLDQYLMEGMNMETLLEQYVRKGRRLLLQELPPEERREEMTGDEILKRIAYHDLMRMLPPEERREGMSVKEILDWLMSEEALKGLPVEEILKRLPPEEILKRLPPEEILKGLPPEKRLEGLSADDLRAALARLEKANSSAPPKPEA